MLKGPWSFDLLCKLSLTNDFIPFGVYPVKRSDKWLNTVKSFTLVKRFVLLDHQKSKAFHVLLF